MKASYLKQKHEAGLPYEQYVQTGDDGKREAWQKIYDQSSITAEQGELLSRFTRRINVIAVSGIWCGDCVQQGPLIQHIAEANPQSIDLRWLDRDEHIDLQKKVAINQGHRVPVLIFCAEDYEPVSWYGDRTLNRYRALAAKQLGPSCPIPGATIEDDELAATLQDWIDQFERVHLLLRLSGRLRQVHGD